MNFRIDKDSNANGNILTQEISRKQEEYIKLINMILMSINDEQKKKIQENNKLLELESKKNIKISLNVNLVITLKESNQKQNTTNLKLNFCPLSFSSENPKNNQKFDHINNLIKIEKEEIEEENKLNLDINNYMNKQIEKYRKKKINKKFKSQKIRLDIRSEKNEKSKEFISINNFSNFEQRSKDLNLKKKNNNLNDSFDSIMPENFFQNKLQKKNSYPEKKLINLKNYKQSDYLIKDKKRIFQPIFKTIEMKEKMKNKKNESILKKKGKMQMEILNFNEKKYEIIHLDGYFYYLVEKMNKYWNRKSDIKNCPNAFKKKFFLSKNENKINILEVYDLSNRFIPSLKEGSNFNYV